ncbi:MAG: hypothetical protein Q8M40_07560 [Legionella sp.]|nr:hypothetical protein [Legionella sp.]
MNVLIVTEPDDIHAVLVKLALEAKEVNCDLLFSADMPSKQKNSISISNDNFSWRTKNSMLDSISNYDKNLDAIWWRRARKPHVPQTLHKDDIMFVRKENTIYHDSIPYILDNKAWWVNPVSSHQKTRSKIIQLQIAQQCGFKLPVTLISNSPEEIRDFISTNINVIYKPFGPQFWSESDGVKVIYTNKISLDDLPSDSMLQMVPGIYQQYIEKKYELRVTCFGSTISAVKIDSQIHSSGITDWRKIPGHQLPLAEIELPKVIKDKIIQFMKKIGVVFGCFDFIVTPEEEIIFLEINEQGQFLWVEQFLPDLYYLDMFSEFLISKNFDFTWSKESKSISANDLDQKAFEIVKENMAKHVYLNQIKRVG